MQEEPSRHPTEADSGTETCRSSRQGCHAILRCDRQVGQPSPRIMRRPTEQSSAHFCHHSSTSLGQQLKQGGTTCFRPIGHVPGSLPAPHNALAQVKPNAPGKPWPDLPRQAQELGPSSLCFSSLSFLTVLRRSPPATPHIAEQPRTTLVSSCQAGVKGVKY